MKPIKFLAQFQEDLFPNRSTVAWEIEAMMLPVSNLVSSPSTEARSAPVRALQPRLPIAHVRSTWTRRAR